MRSAPARRRDNGPPASVRRTSSRRRGVVAPACCVKHVPNVVGLSGPWSQSAAVRRRHVRVPGGRTCPERALLAAKRGSRAGPCVGSRARGNSGHGQPGHVGVPGWKPCPERTRRPESSERRNRRRSRANRRGAGGGLLPAHSTGGARPGRYRTTLACGVVAEARRCPVAPPFRTRAAGSLRVGTSRRQVDENLTGFENLELVGRLYHLGRRAARARASQLLGDFDLTEAAEQLVRTYSGGMRRKLDLAATLVARPPVLFLDEPTTGLDIRCRMCLWDAIEALVAPWSTPPAPSSSARSPGTTSGAPSPGRSASSPSSACSRCGATGVQSGATRRPRSAPPAGRPSASSAP
jgi:hypothetical protein